LEVSKPVGLALKEFHFGVETFVDSIVAGESPTGFLVQRDYRVLATYSYGDILAKRPGESPAQRNTWLQSRDVRS
jgi:hypothetical protein